MARVKNIPLATDRSVYFRENGGSWREQVCFAVLFYNGQYPRTSAYGSFGESTFDFRIQYPKKFHWWASRFIRQLSREKFIHGCKFYEAKNWKNSYWRFRSNKYYPDFFLTWCVLRYTNSRPRLVVAAYKLYQQLKDQGVTLTQCMHFVYKNKETGGHSHLAGSSDYLPRGFVDLADTLGMAFVRANRETDTHDQLATKFVYGPETGMTTSGYLNNAIRILGAYLLGGDGDKYLYKNKWSKEGYWRFMGFKFENPLPFTPKFDYIGLHPTWARFVNNPSTTSREAVLDALHKVKEESFASFARAWKKVEKAVY